MKTIVNKTEKMIDIEQRTGESIEETLRIMWVEKNYSRAEMCKALGINHITLIDWLEKAGIYSRKLDF